MTGYGKKSKVTVDIYGESYALKGTSDAAYIQRVADMLNERMKEIAKVNPRLSSNKIAVLAALNIADDYLRLEQDYQQLLQMLNESKNRP